MKILLIILLLLLGLLLLPLRFVLSRREELGLELQIFFWHRTLLPAPPKPPKGETQKTAEGAKAEKKAPDKPKKKLDSGQLLQLLSLGKSALQSLGRPLGWFLGQLKLRDLWLDIVIVQEDAHKTALRYGQIQAALHNLLALMGRHIVWKPEELRIRADFMGEEERLWGGVSLTLRPLTLLIFGLWFLGRFGIKLIQDWWANKKMARQLSKQTTASNGKD